MKYTIFIVTAKMSFLPRQFVNNRFYKVFATDFNRKIKFKLMQNFICITVAEI